MTQQEIIRAELKMRIDAHNHYEAFAKYVHRFSYKDFHLHILREVQDLYEGKFKKIMFFLPPQHGKSTVVTRTAIPWFLGKNPDLRIAITSYSADIAQGFNSDIQELMDDQLYQNVFPNTKLPKKGFGGRNNAECKIRGKKGRIFAVGTGGPLTSKTVDIGIIDDPVKDRAEANSTTIREKTWGWYLDVFSTRLHNDAKQLLIMTRWHPDDLAGRLLAKEGIYDAETNPNGWRVITYKAIKEEDDFAYDQRALGEALFPERHDLERLLSLKKTMKASFDALYQQKPSAPKETLCIPEWHEIDEIPNIPLVYVGGLDFGFTNDPSVLLKIGIDVSAKCIYIDEAIYGTGLSGKKLAKRVKELGLTWLLIYADHRPDSIDDMNEEGLSVIKAEKGPESILLGLQTLNDYTIYVTSRSSNVKREFLAYSYITVGEVITNVPLAGNDHCADAARYGVYSYLYASGMIESYN